MIRYTGPMIQKIGSLASVTLHYNHKVNKATPLFIFWNNRKYVIEEIGTHFTYFEGRTKIHVFCVLAQALSFKLEFNSETLNWQIVEISDGMPD
jgi:hypothetical protein